MYSKALTSEARTEELPESQAQLSKKRQVVLDVETTGINIDGGHRIIEIAAVELLDRRITGNRLHWFLNPDRDIDPEAQAAHGISREFLRDKPKFSAIAQEFSDFIRGSELIAHNAQFDLGFVDHELKVLGMECVRELCSGVTDTLSMAREKRPGKANSLNALCEAYQISSPANGLHGANLDAHMLAQVYLALQHF